MSEEDRAKFVRDSECYIKQCDEGELDAFRYHEGFRLQEKRRKEVFDAMIEQMRMNYEVETEKILENRLAAFKASIRVSAQTLSQK